MTTDFILICLSGGFLLTGYCFGIWATKRAPRHPELPTHPELDRSMRDIALTAYGEGWEACNAEWKQNTIEAANKNGITL